MTNKPEDTTHWYFALKLRWANRGSLQSSSSSKHILQVSEYGQFPLSIDYTQMVKWEEPLAFFMHRNIPSYPNQYRGGTRIQSLLKNHFLSLFFVFSFFFCHSHPQSWFCSSVCLFKPSDWFPVFSWAYKSLHLPDDAFFIAPRHCLHALGKTEIAPRIIKTELAQPLVKYGSIASQKGLPMEMHSQS